MMERLIVKVYEYGDDDLDCSGEKLISLSCDQFSDAAARYELGQNIKTACQICGSSNHVEGHHLIDHQYGGGADADNIVALCRECHKDVHRGLIDLITF